MGSTAPPDQGNLAILTKVDKLRELIGSKVALPQLVVVGDQSSGKSSVLEGLTGFGFPRDAELCTRYATQITCRRETEKSISVSIIPSDEASSHDLERIKNFHCTLKEMTPESLARVFKEANKAMGIRASTTSTSSESLPAFSEHILKIEKLGPKEEHFTVIDVPGIFRKETEGVTTGDDIELVRNMVQKYMKDSRTIILAIMPSNVDPATQEILKLAKEADRNMTRTMAVLTKPDLAIERTQQRIVMNLVEGNRSDLTLGYYIVKNRGPDDVDKTLEQGQADETKFFSQPEWTNVRRLGKAGIAALKSRVRGLLTDLIKKEFPKLKAEIAKELLSLRAQRDKMGPSRSTQDTQRAYLNKMSEEFQTIARDAVNAYYTGNEIFDTNYDLRLITRIVEAHEKYADSMWKTGHTRPFADDSKSEADESIPGTPSNESEFSDLDFCPELDEILDPVDLIIPETSGPEDIMKYIGEVYRASRGQELGTFNPAMVSTMFKEQTKKWKPITLSYMNNVIRTVHRFIVKVIGEVCPDSRVRDELWNGFILEELQKSYREAMKEAKFLLALESNSTPLTLNHYFNSNLQKAQSERLVSAIEKVGNERGLRNHYGTQESGLILTKEKLETLSLNMGNSEYNQSYIHDILKSYYKVSQKKFVDVVCQRAVQYHLLQSEQGPLKIFSTQMVLGLNEEQLDMIAAEDSPVKIRREKLGRDIEYFEKALKVLKGST